MADKQKTIYMRKYRAENAEEYREYQRAYKKAWRAKNRAKYNAYQRELYKKRKEGKEREVE